MPSGTPQKEEAKVDHRAKALRLLEESYSVPAETAEQAGRDAIATALVHSQLAVAEELKGIREALSGQVEGRYRQALSGIIGLTLDEGERNDNKVREQVHRIAVDALEGRR